MPPPVINKSIGCLFCEMVGSVSSVNQHVRSFHKAATAGRKSRLRDYHPVQICQAFEHLTKEQSALLYTVTRERLAVLTAFATLATKPLPSDAAVQDWGKRDYHSFSADWWERQVDIAARKYRASNYDEDLLELHVERVIADCIDKAMNEICRSVDPPERRPPGPTTRPGWGSLAISGGDLNMQGERSTHHNQSSANEIAHGDYIDQHRNINTRGEDNHTDDGIQTDEGNLSDDELLYDPPPPKLSVMKQRGAGLFASRSVSSSSSSTAAQRRNDSSAPPPPPRVVSAPTRYTYGPPSKCVTGALPFLVLNVCVINNKVHTIPIEYGTTLDEAVALAVSVAPKWMRDSNVQFCFEGRRGGKWVGMWPESRWNRVMGEAESNELVVDLRLVTVE